MDYTTVLTRALQRVLDAHWQGIKDLQRLDLGLDEALGFVLCSTYTVMEQLAQQDPQLFVRYMDGFAQMWMANTPHGQMVAAKLDLGHHTSEVGKAFSDYVDFAYNTAIHTEPHP